MSELGEQHPADVYNDLFHLNNGNIGLDGTLRTIQSGNGQDTGIQVSQSQTQINFGGGQAVRPEIKAGKYTYASNPGVSGASYSVSLLSGNVQTLTLSGSLTNLVITDSPSSGIAGWVRLIIERTTFSITNWPAGTKWQGATPLDLSSTTAGTSSIVDFMTVDGGSTWYAVTVATSMA